MNNKTIAVVLNGRWDDSRETENLRIYFKTPQGCRSLDEQNPDIIVIEGGAISLDKEKLIKKVEQGEMALEDAERLLQGLNEELEKQVESRTRQILNALNEGKSVCLVSGSYDNLIDEVFHTLEIRPNHLEKARVDIAVRKSEFKRFLSKCGRAEYCFDENEVDDVICWTTKGPSRHNVAGFLKKKNNGSLVFLPGYFHYIESDPDYKNYKDFIDFAILLLQNLITYLTGVREEPSPWIEKFAFPDEKLLRDKASEIEEKLRRYSNLKRILWCGGHFLTDAVESFFKNVGFETKRNERGEEDFWIVDDSKERVIVEVKGKAKNLDRGAVQELCEHREASGKPDSFPALLVVNSFREASSLNEKDKAISDNEIKKAVRHNVLLMRTLDLCRAYILFEKGQMDKSKMLNILENECGWAKITDEGCKIIK
jgi:hypothetical protein